MKDTALYEHLLGLKTPWSVKSVDLSLADQRVVVEVVLKPGQVWVDPTDSTKRAHINGWTERQWRHLDTCQFETLIKARVPQLKYSDGTVEELAVPWAERYSRVTLLMEAFVVKLLQACPTTQGVCELTRLAWSTVNGIMVSAVERGMLRRSEEDVPHLGLDEKSSERGHTYASILTDIDRSRVLDLVLHYYSMPTSRVVIEIKGFATGDSARLEEAVNNYRSLGYKIALDNFGTAYSSGAAYSSLDKALNLRPDIIKLDGGLIRKAEHTSRVKSLIHGLVEIFHKLGAQVVIEGIETARQATIARDAGADLLQGYYLGHPEFSAGAWGQLCRNDQLAA